jgi:hypothetical protein
MRQAWPPQFKNGFWDLFARGKSQKVSVLGAESSHQLHDSMTFPEKINFSQIFGIPPPLSRFFPSRPPMMNSRQAPPGDGEPEEKQRPQHIPPIEGYC